MNLLNVLHKITLTFLLIEEERKKEILIKKKEMQEVILQIIEKEILKSLENWFNFNINPNKSQDDIKHDVNLTIADYGSAIGINSFKLIENIIKKLIAKCNIPSINGNY